MSSKEMMTMQSHNSEKSKKLFFLAFAYNRLDQNCQDHKLRVNWQFTVCFRELGQSYPQSACNFDPLI